MNDIFIVPLTNSEAICLIDAEDAPRVMQKTWYYCRGTRYVRASSRFGRVLLHKFVKDVGDNLTDHINRNVFDNRKSNLRPATHSLNAYNAAKFSNTTSKYKGVSYRKDSGKWRARIQINRTNIALGVFLTEQEAALAYNKKALEIWGEEAILNVI